MECYYERAFYYWRHGYYGHVQLICSKALEKMSNDLFLRIWNLLSLGILGKTEIALEQLSRINNREDLSLLFTVSQLCLVNISANKDNQQINELKEQIEKQVKHSNKFCISQSAQVAFMFNNLNLSNHILSYLKDPISISGWIKLTTGEYSLAEQIFDSVLNTSGEKSDLLSLYGKYVIFLITSKNPESIEIYDEIVNRYHFPEINMERARSSATNHRFDHAILHVKKYEQIFPTSIEIDIYHALNSIIKEGDLYTAAQYLDRVCQICEKYESLNWKLNVKLALVFCTLSSQDLSVINQTIRLSQLAYQTNPTSSICLQVSALHHIITRNYGVAQSIIKSIDFNNKDNAYSNFNSQLILMKVFRQDRELGDALDLYEKIENNFCVSTYRSYLTRRKNQDASRFIPLIVKDLENILSLSKSEDNRFFTPLENQKERFLELFVSLRLETIFDSFDEIVVLNNSVRTPLVGQLGTEIESFVTDLLNPLNGYVPLLFVQAVLLFKQGRYYESEYLFQSILISKWKYRISDCLVYLARIDLINDKTSLAKTKINEALSLNDQLKNDYNFHLIRTEIYKDQEHLHALIPFFENPNHSFSSILEFLDLAISLNSFEVAAKIYQVVKPKANGTLEKGSLVIRKARILAGNHRFNETFQLLDKLKNHSCLIDLATLTESEIRYQYNKGSFIECLEKLYKDQPNSKHSEMIGDAYVKIIDFLNAAKWYKMSVIDYGTPSSDTFQKYIKALISSHRFDEAVLRFTDTFSKMKPNSFTLIFLLKELVRIERFKEAKKCIDKGMNLITKINLIVEGDFFGLCGIVSWKLNDMKMARKYFKKAATVYDGIFMDYAFNSISNNELREQASLFFISYARFCTSIERIEKANDLYARAIELDESNAEPVLALVKYYKSRYEVHKCIRLCTEFLKRYPNNERVALELTTVGTSDYSSSIRCLTKVLKSHPHFYRILIRLIEICARAGRLKEVAGMITKDAAPGMVLARGLFSMYCGYYDEAISTFTKIQDHPVWGLSAQISIVQILVNPERKYCWCTEGPLSTDESLSKASDIIDKIARPKTVIKKTHRNDDLTFEIDPIFKVLLLAEVEIARNTQASISNAASLYSTVVEIQGEILQGQRNEDEKILDKNLNGYENNSNGTMNNLNESENNSNNSNNNLNTNNNLKNFASALKSNLNLANNNDNNNNTSNTNSTNILYNSNSKLVLNQTQYIAALVGLARCEIRLHHPNKAANLITEVLKRKPYHETFSFFEEAYLMRAQLFFDEGDSAQAQHFYLMTLQLNMSCKKAWEMSAMLHKKNKMFTEAADAYLHCWNLSGKKDIEAGYQFALCSMKANRPEDALEMCRMISEMNPIFKDLRDKILIPSFQKLKS